MVLNRYHQGATSFASSTGEVNTYLTIRPSLFGITSSATFTRSPMKGSSDIMPVFAECPSIISVISQNHSAGHKASVPFPLSHCNDALHSHQCWYPVPHTAFLPQADRLLWSRTPECFLCL